MDENKFRDMGECDTLEEFFGAFRWTQIMYAELFRRYLDWQKSVKEGGIGKGVPAARRRKESMDNWIAMQKVEEQLHTLSSMNRKFKTQVVIDWKNLSSVIIRKVS